jgi:acetyl-CoA carboxylase biotin carboxylase subunit
LFKKLLIANRGEIALRIIRTCKELDIQTVAVYSESDKDSLHVVFADEAVCIGPASSKDSYLKIPSILSAAQVTGADAIHPGYGFLAENAEFSEICSDTNIKFIGPSPDMINKMGNKAFAKETMKKVGVPVVPGSDGIVKNVKEAKLIAAEIEYPVMLKASAGGGGKGMRIVWNEDEVEKAFQTASMEAEAAFHNGDLYVEKFVENPRHVEIQVMGDQFGNVYHYGERDCSIQRRHQKLIEESPSPIITEEIRNRMCDAAVLGSQSVNYEGAGTVEFIVDKYLNFYFIEMVLSLELTQKIRIMVSVHLQE